MRQKSAPEKAPAGQVVKDIRRAMRRQFSAEEKIRIVLDGVRGEESIPETILAEIVELALRETELSPDELAARFTDKNGHFVPKAASYRLLNAHDLIACPAYIVVKAASEFKDKTTTPNQL